MRKHGSICYQNTTNFEPWYLLVLLRTLIGKMYSLFTTANLTWRAVERLLRWVVSSFSIHCSPQIVPTSFFEPCIFALDMLFSNTIAEESWKILFLGHRKSLNLKCIPKILLTLYNVITFVRFVQQIVCRRSTESWCADHLVSEETQAKVIYDTRCRWHGFVLFISLHSVRLSCLAANLILHSWNDLTLPKCRHSGT